MHYNIYSGSDLVPDCRQWKVHSHKYHILQPGQHVCRTVGMTGGHASVMPGIHTLQHIDSFRTSNLPYNDAVHPHDKKVKVNLRRCLYECDLSCARCWWLLYGNAEPGPGFPSCPAGSCGIRPDGSGIFYLGWPVPDAPVLSGRKRGDSAWLVKLKRSCSANTAGMILSLRRCVVIVVCRFSGVRTAIFCINISVRKR